MRITLLAAGLVLLCTGACGGNGTTVQLSDSEVKDAQADSADVRFRSKDLAPEVAPDLLELPGAELPGPLCRPGEGCFGDKCVDNPDCLSGWCVEHMGEKVCTQPCQEECPEGWSCQALAGTGRDVLFLCVSLHPTLCRPCTSATDCDGAAQTEEACLDYGPGGSFCGGSCGKGGECPWGFSCQKAQTVDGVTLEQCVADTGVCPCTGTSVELGLWTSCEAASQWGSCQGKRVCEANGLTECDAPIPVAETCNGIDDDCDSEVDEPALVEGKYHELCDDDNECTEDKCLGDQGCTNEALQSGTCEDGDPCTVADHCEAGLCVGDLVLCDDANPCTDDVCTLAGGCDHPANTAPCDDGNPCTLADVCSEGTCGGTPVPCDCQNDGDCAAFEDGNLCNGTLVCATDTLPYECQVDPGSVVECPEPAGLEALCQKAFCNPDDGQCSFVPDHEGQLCDADNQCSFGEKCAGGSCSGGKTVNCNDGNVCTDDSCAPETGCVHTYNAAPCDDGSACTMQDVCSGGACVAGNVLECEDMDPCTQDSCDPAVGCKHEPLTGPACDDGNACTTGDSCVDGKCAPAAMLDCEDGNLCTTDTCDLAAGCIHTLNSGPCDDGDLCTISDHCHLGSCIGGGALVCKDSNPCTDDGCQPLVGCTFAPNDALCDDGNACTLDDGCTGGWCIAGALADCDDSNPCTDDSCLPDKGCLHTFNAAPCDDGNPCTTGDKCTGGACTGTTCEELGTTCKDGTCLPLCGNGKLESGEGCDDGNVKDGDGCSASCLVELAQVPSPGMLVITEIMKNPDSVLDNAGEWFEVMNVSTVPVDVNGWTIRDDGGEAHVIKGGGAWSFQDPPVPLGAVTFETYSHGGGYSPKYKEFWYPSFSSTTVHRLDAGYKHVGQFETQDSEMIQLWGELDGSFYTATWTKQLIRKYPGMGQAPAWQFNIGWTAAGVCSDGQFVYAMQDHLDKVWKLDPKTGAVLGTFNIPGAATGFYGGLICIPGRIYYGEGLTGVVRIYDINTKQQIGTFTNPAPIQNASFDGKTMYVSANNSTVYRYQLLKGNLYGEPVVIPPGKSFVFGNNSDSKTNGGITVGYAYSGFTLGNADDEVILQAPDGMIIDAVAYDDSPFPDKTGYSLSLAPAHTDPVENDDGTHWCSSPAQLPSGDHATPGEANPPCSP